jgi:hypothetical protein
VPGQLDQAREAHTQAGTAEASLSSWAPSTSNRSRTPLGLHIGADALHVLERVGEVRSPQQMPSLSPWPAPDPFPRLVPSQGLVSSANASVSVWALAEVAEMAQGLGLPVLSLQLWRQLRPLCSEALQPVALLRVALQEVLALGPQQVDLAQRLDSLQRWSRPVPPDAQADPLYWRLAPLPHAALGRHPAATAHVLEQLHAIYQFVAPRPATYAAPGAWDATATGLDRLVILTDREVDCLLVEDLITSEPMRVMVLAAGRPLSCEFWDEASAESFETRALPRNLSEAVRVVQALEPTTVLFTDHHSPFLHHLAMLRLAPLQVCD